jgi:hypothetical protein
MREIDGCASLAFARPMVCGNRLTADKEALAAAQRTSDEV